MASPQYGSIAEPEAVALDLSEDAVRVRVKRRRDGADDGGDNERGTGFVRSTVALLALFLFCSVLVASNYDLVVQTVLATSSKLELVTSSSSSSGPSPGSAPTVVATNTKVLTTPGTSTTSTSTSSSTSSSTSTSTSTSQSTTVLATGTVTGTAATDEAGLLVDFKMNRIGYTPINLSDDVLYYEFIRAKGYSVIYEPHAEMNLVVMDWTDSSVYYKCEFGSACLSEGRPSCNTLHFTHPHTPHPTPPPPQTSSARPRTRKRSTAKRAPFRWTRASPTSTSTSRAPLMTST